MFGDRIFDWFNEDGDTWSKGAKRGVFGGCCVAFVVIAIFGGAYITEKDILNPWASRNQDESDQTKTTPSVMSVDEMKTCSTAATTCAFYDEKFGNSLKGKPVKLPGVKVMKVGNNFIAVNSGSPDTYAVINMRDGTSNIKSGDTGTVYAIYDGMKADPNDPNKMVPTFKDGIFEPASAKSGK